jgi:nitrite reductase/ring-hydroxylating ferredoxin subunit/uncharacterized membrane protein
MEGRQLTDLISQQPWLEPIDQALERAVDAAVAAGGEAARPVRRFLHGSWLGHPLHPALTDVPIGAWTTAAVLDALDVATGGDRLAAGADAAVAVGLAGAVGAAVTGLNDWQPTDGRARKVGVAHGLLNGGATLLYGISLIMRKRGARAAGRGFGFAGLLVVTASAWLGGHLVSEERIGVDHSRDRPLPDDFVPVLPAAELAEGTLQRVEANGTPILLVRRGERIHALAETCSHLGGPLAEGELRGDSVVCPWHGSRFALVDGRVLDGPSSFPQPCLQVRVRDGQIEVRASEA